MIYVLKKALQDMIALYMFTKNASVDITNKNNNNYLLIYNIKTTIYRKNDTQQSGDDIMTV